MPLQRASEARAMAFDAEYLPCLRKALPARAVSGTFELQGRPRCVSPFQRCPALCIVHLEYFTAFRAVRDRLIAMAGMRPSTYRLPFWNYPSP